MWLPVGSKSRFRPVSGGLVVERHCDECNQTRTFVECEVTDKVSVLFVPVFDMASRRLVCQECGEDDELPPALAAPSPPAGSRSSTKPPPAPARPSATDLDKMLADLKKKMGK